MFDFQYKNRLKMPKRPSNIRGFEENFHPAKIVKKLYLKVSLRKRSYLVIFGAIHVFFKNILIKSPHSTGTPSENRVETKFQLWI